MSFLFFFFFSVIQLRKGSAAARGDDTKGLKGAVIDWITPSGQALNPPISRNSKVNRGFHHEVTGALLCPTYMDWSDQAYVGVLDLFDL